MERGNRQGYYHADFLPIHWGRSEGGGNGEDPRDRLPIGADQKIPNWLIKIAFLVKVKTAIRLSMKSKFGTMGTSTSDAIWGQWFFSLTIYIIHVTIWRNLLFS